MHIDSDNIIALEIGDLRSLWSKLWGKYRIVIFAVICLKEAFYLKKLNLAVNGSMQNSKPASVSGLRIEQIAKRENLSARYVGRLIDTSLEVHNA